MIDWQFLTVLILLAVAVVYLGIRYVRRRRGKVSCANCALYSAVRRPARRSKRTEPQQQISRD